LLLLGVNKAATAIYFIANFAKPEDDLSWAKFDREHVSRLVSILRDGDDESWALKALKFLCEKRSDLSDSVRFHASGAPRILKVALLYCASSGDSGPVFEALTEFAGMGPDRCTAQPIHVLKQMELGWAQHEELLIQLLRLRDTQLALVLLGMVYQDQSLKEVDIGPIEWWLDWLVEERAESGFWFRYQMAWLFGSVLSAGARNALLTEFNSGSSRFRRVLADYVLPRFPNLTTDSFSDDAISFLLADLNRKGSAVGFNEPLLGRTATEQFATDRLLPLLPDAKPPFSINLQKVLRQAGSRHGRRYVNA
jgi:hypothetical protein